MDNDLIINTHPRPLYVGRMDPNPEWGLKEHRHDYCEVVYIAEGGGTLRVGREQYQYAAGDMLVFNRGFPHEERSDPKNPLKSYYCAIGDLSVKGLPDGCLLPDGVSPVFHTGKYSQRICSYMKNLYEECNSEIYGYQTMACSALLALIVMIMRLVAMADKDGKSMEDSIGWKIKEYLDNNYASAKNIEEIADRLYISPYYLAHAFKNHTGQPPVDYLIKKRMKKAMELLESGNYKIYEVAELVGYSDPNYFSTAFKKVTGVSPSQYGKKK